MLQDVVLNVFILNYLAYFLYNILYNLVLWHFGSVQVDTMVSAYEEKWNTV